MIELLLFFVLLGIATVVSHLWPVEEWAHQIRQWLLGEREREVRSDLHRASDALDQEYAKARKQMNDAAGQSWRNPFE